MSKSSPSDPLAACGKYGRSVDDKLITLNGAFVASRRDAEDHNLVTLYHGRKRANLRFSSELVHTVYNLQKFIVGYDLSPKWYSVPLKMVNNDKKVIRCIDGAEYRCSLRGLLNKLCGIQVRQAWKMSIQEEAHDIRMFDGARANSDFVGQIFKKFVKCNLDSDDARSVREFPCIFRDVLYLVLQTIAHLLTSKLSETLQEYVGIKAAPLPSEVVGKTSPVKPVKILTDAKPTPVAKSYPAKTVKALPDGKSIPVSKSYPAKTVKTLPVGKTTPVGKISLAKTVKALPDGRSTPVRKTSLLKAAMTLPVGKSNPGGNTYPVKTAKTCAVKKSGMMSPAKKSGKSSPVSHKKTVNYSPVFNIPGSSPTRPRGVSSPIGSPTRSQNLRSDHRHASGSKKPELPVDSMEPENHGATSPTMYQAGTRDFSNAVQRLLLEGGHKQKRDSLTEAACARRDHIPQSEIKLKVTSNTHFLSDVTVSITDGTNPIDVSPWGLQLCIEESKSYQDLSAAELGDPRHTTFLGWEAWASVPEGTEVELKLVPEKGSPAFGMMLSKRVVKPIPKMIDFTDPESDLYRSKKAVVFARTRGKGHKMWFRYMVPIGVRVDKNWCICIKNNVTGKQWITASNTIPDIHRFLLEEAPDRGDGYGDLEFFRGGKLIENSVVNETYFTKHDAMEYSVRAAARNSVHLSK